MDIIVTVLKVINKQGPRTGPNTRFRRHYFNTQNYLRILFLQNLPNKEPSIKYVTRGVRGVNEV